MRGGRALAVRAAFGNATPQKRAPSSPTPDADVVLLNPLPQHHLLGPPPTPPAPTSTFTQDRDSRRPLRRVGARSVRAWWDEGGAVTAKRGAGRRLRLRAFGSSLWSQHAAWEGGRWGGQGEKFVDEVQALQHNCSSTHAHDTTTSTVAPPAPERKQRQQLRGARHHGCLVREDRRPGVAAHGDGASHHNLHNHGQRPGRPCSASCRLGPPRAE